MITLYYAKHADCVVAVKDILKNVRLYFGAHKFLCPAALPGLTITVDPPVGQLLTKIQNREICEKVFVPSQPSFRDSFLRRTTVSTPF